MEEFDFIIVGAGSAGCALAYRLSQDRNNRVLLLEDGPTNNHPLVKMPKGFGKLLTDPSRIWAMPITGTYQNPEYWVGGRMLGGSGSINGLLYNRGHDQDYESWSMLGGPVWSAANMAKVYRDMEAGFLSTLRSKALTDLHSRLIEAGTQCGLALHEQTDHPIGWLGYPLASIGHGCRAGPAEAFLKDAGARPNLKILTGIKVRKLSIDRKHVRGVDCGDVQYSAKREVIVSAGVINSPRLLQLSGIGPADHLKSIGIDPVVDLPGVGENFADHRYLAVKYRLARPDLSTNRRYHGVRLLGQIIAYQLFGSGVLSAAPAEIAGELRIAPGADRTDAHFIAQSFSSSLSPQGKVLVDSEPRMTVLMAQSRPESRGSINLSSKAPDDLPLIRHTHLSTDADRSFAVELVRAMRRIMAAPALQGIVVGELTPGHSPSTPDEMIAAFRDQGVSGQHGVGTCRIGTDAAAVVDGSLRVHGVNGLRVADCSVIPHCISGAGGTAAAAMAIGWRAADFILDPDQRIPR